MLDAEKYWQAVARQDARQLESFFAPNACIRWHNTNEQFTAQQFIRANCEYPGRWCAQVERVETQGCRMVTVCRVYAPDGSASFHAVSFMCLENGRISTIDEYWGEDGPPPAWRKAMDLAEPIR